MTPGPSPPGPGVPVGGPPLSSSTPPGTSRHRSRELSRRPLTGVSGRCESASLMNIMGREVRAVIEPPSARHPYHAQRSSTELGPSAGRRPPHGKDQPGGQRPPAEPGGDKPHARESPGVCGEWRARW